MRKRNTERIERIEQAIAELVETVNSLAEVQRDVWKVIKETDRQLGDIGNSRGDAAEDLFRRAFQPQMEARGIELHPVRYRVQRKWGREFDLVGENAQFVVLGEIKYQLKRWQVGDFVTDQIPAFRREHPEYDHLKLLGVIAGIVVEPKVERYAEEMGLYVLTQNGEGGATIANPPEFKAREFAIKT